MNQFNQLPSESPESAMAQVVPWENFGGNLEPFRRPVYSDPEDYRNNYAGNNETVGGVRPTITHQT